MGDDEAGLLETWLDEAKNKVNGEKSFLEAFQDVFIQNWSADDTKEQVYLNTKKLYTAPDQVGWMDNRSETEWKNEWNQGQDFACVYFFSHRVGHVVDPLIRRVGSISVFFTDRGVEMIMHPDASRTSKNQPTS